MEGIKLSICINSCMHPTFIHSSSFFRYLVFSLHNIKSENKKHMKIYDILINIFFFGTI